MRGVGAVQRSALVRVPTSSADAQWHQHHAAGGRRHVADERPDLRARLLLVALSARHVHRPARRPVHRQRQPRSRRQPRSGQRH